MKPVGPAAAGGDLAWGSVEFLALTRKVRMGEAREKLLPRICNTIQPIFDVQSEEHAILPLYPVHILWAMGFMAHGLARLNEAS